MHLPARPPTGIRPQKGPYSVLVGMFTVTIELHLVTCHIVHIDFSLQCIAVEFDFPWHCDIAGQAVFGYLVCFDSK